MQSGHTLINAGLIEIWGKDHRFWVFFSLSSTQLFFNTFLQFFIQFVKTTETWLIFRDGMGGHPTAARELIEVVARVDRFVQRALNQFTSGFAGGGLTNRGLIPNELRAKPSTIETHSSRITLLDRIGIGRLYPIRSGSILLRLIKTGLSLVDLTLSGWDQRISGQFWCSRRETSRRVRTSRWIFFWNKRNEKLLQMKSINKLLITWEKDKRNLSVVWEDGRRQYQSHSDSKQCADQ